MIYNDKSIFRVYLISAILLSGLIYITYFLNMGDILHGYESKGTIAAYWGIKPPRGWVLCDGQNNTPDLRGKFVFGGSTNSQNFLDDIRNKNIPTNLDVNIYNIEGGNNYQTLTNKVVNIDPYIEPTIELSDKTEYFHNEIYTNIEVNNTDRKYAYQNTRDTLYNNLMISTNTDEPELSKQEIEKFRNNEHVIDFLKNITKDDNNVVDPNFNIQNFDDEQIEDAVNSILITEVPQFEGYKYPANKSIHGDTNLPPYYALIFIMKI